MIDLIRNRRSVRKFTEQSIEIQKIKLLEEALLRSPTSKNSNAWQFVFVDQPDLIKQLADSKPQGSRFLESAKLAVVIAANTSQTSAWVEDCSIASIILQLEAHSLGLGSCWVQIRNRAHNENVSAEDYVKRTLDMPETLRVLSVVGIGYPAQVRKGKADEELQRDKIHRNIFGQNEQ